MSDETVNVPIDQLCDVLAWVELDDDLDDEMRMNLMVLSALVGDAISAQPESDANSRPLAVFIPPTYQVDWDRIREALEDDSR